MSLPPCEPAKSASLAAHPAFHVRSSCAEIDGPVVYLRLAGACGSCPSSLTTMTMGIKRRLMERIPVGGVVMVVVVVVQIPLLRLVRISPLKRLVSPPQQQQRQQQLTVLRLPTCCQSPPSLPRPQEILDVEQVLEENRGLELTPGGADWLGRRGHAVHWRTAQHGSLSVG